MVRCLPTLAGEGRRVWHSGVNSFTAKSILGGTKNSRWEGFWLVAKHKHAHIPTVM